MARRIKRLVPAPPGGGQDPGTDPLEEIRRFYDSLAPDYDLMTSFDARFAKELPWFDAIVSRFGITSALDAGCGTGFHSILLSRLNVAVTGVDASPAMVKLAAKNSRRLGIPITALEGNFSELIRIAPGPFDAVFCLGNSLVHLINDDALDTALRNFRDVLRPGGITVLQLLNYERILAGRDELLGRREAGGATFERRYSYHGDLITFSIVKSEIVKNGQSVGIGPGTGRGDARENRRTEGVVTVSLRPLTRGRLTAASVRAGFTDAETFGDLAMGMYDPAGSPDLVLLARKPGPS